MFVCLLVRFVFNVDFDVVKNVSVVIELIYMVLIVYDDVVDNVDLRCGCEMIKLKWGNYIVMYIGDFLFVKLLEYMIEIKDVVVYKMLLYVMVEFFMGEIE